MGTLIVVVLLALGVYLVWKLLKNPDVNNDGKVDVQDVVAAAKEVATEVKEEAAVVVEKAKKIRKPRAKKA